MSQIKSIRRGIPFIDPNVFNRIQPEIDLCCDEMLRSGVRFPSREIVDRMTRRVFDNCCARFPDMVGFAQAFDRHFTFSQDEMFRAFGVETMQAGAFLGFLSFLLLSSFFFRRRFRRRTRRFI